VSAGAIGQAVARRPGLLGRGPIVVNVARGLLMNAAALATPHVSAVSPARFWDRTMGLFLEDWGRYERGERRLNQVDASAGY
jgi:hypothetical protein